MRSARLKDWKCLYVHNPVTVKNGKHKYSAVIIYPSSFDKKMKDRTSWLALYYYRDFFGGGGAFCPPEISFAPLETVYQVYLFRFN